MRPGWSAFVEMGRRHEANVEAAIYLSGGTGPLVQVLPEVSAALVELNATLGFDLYAFPDSDGETTEPRDAAAD